MPITAPEEWMPVAVGIPRVSGGLVETVRNPIYATGVGLVYYGLRHGNSKTTFTKTSGINGIWQRLKDIVEEFFG